MGVISDYVPGLAEFDYSKIITGLTWFILIIIIGIAAGFIVYFYMRSKRFSKTIIIFERVNDRFQITGKDKAMVVKFGRGGDTVFRLRKYKKFLPTPTLQTGRNLFWYFIREDGEWINFTVTDLDQLQKESNAKFLDKEMRYARASLQKNLRDRYDKISFFQKYGGVITYTVLIIVVGIVIWLWFDKIIKISANILKATEIAKELVEMQKSLLGSMDVVSSGIKSSGAVILSLLL